MWYTVNSFTADTVRQHCTQSTWCDTFRQNCKTCLALKGILANIYRPQRSCGQGNIFTPVCHSVHWGVCLSASWDTTPPGSRPPLEQTPPRSRHPPEPDTPGLSTPPREADSGVLSKSGRYASYWNVHTWIRKFLLQKGRNKTWIHQVTFSIQITYSFLLPFLFCQVFCIFVMALVIQIQYVRIWVLQWIKS